MTLSERLIRLTEQFKAAAIDEASLDAQYILAAVLNVKRTKLLLDLDKPFPEEHEAHLKELSAKREQRLPLAYVLEEQPFMDLSLWVSPDVLVPRPETELLVERVQNLLDRFQNPVVADIGTGSGNIAIALARDPRVRQVAAVDVSPAALAVAQRNAATHQVSEKIVWYLGDLAVPLQRSGAQFDIIVANLPYVSRGDIPHLTLEVQSEPHLALDGGVDGLDLITRLIQQAPALLKDHGYLMLEIDAAKSTTVCARLLEAGWEGITLIKDGSGLTRFVQAQVRSLAPSEQEAPVGSFHG